MSIWSRYSPSFGFVSTRLAGTDGVSLETQKWVDVLESKGCRAYYMAGELDRSEEVCQLTPKAFFQHPEILTVQQALFGAKSRRREITNQVHALKEELKDALPPDDVKKTADKLYRLLSPGAVVGGGPLWGVDGVAAIAHGASMAPQIAGTIGQARQAVESGFVAALKTELQAAQAKIAAGDNQ